MIKEHFADPLGRTPQEALSAVYPHLLEDIPRHTKSLEFKRAKPKDLRDWWATVLSTESLAPLRDGELLSEAEKRIVQDVTVKSQKRERLPDVRLGSGLTTIVITEEGTEIGAAVRVPVETNKVTAINDPIGVLMRGIRNDVDRILIWPEREALDPATLVTTPKGSIRVAINKPSGPIFIDKSQFDNALEMVSSLSYADVRRIGLLAHRRIMEIGNEPSIDREIDRLLQKLGMDYTKFCDIAETLPAQHEAAAWSLLRVAMDQEEPS
ncbi:hypothetical protein [Aestuariivita boseongensis]|uniref:hypothetical protein n=1 Tax=Aestuariivita boseongensis TaxID=1470562 RepID=UPI0006811E8D|nr:hypothetical protein [Aestuariivita boseongensis]